MHRPTRIARGAAGALLVLSASACIDLGEALPVRLFEPAPGASLDQPPANASASTSRTAFELEAVRVRAPIDLAMLWRISPVELEKDEANRWAAEPASFVQERVRAALPAPSGEVEGTASLQVRVLAFEGLREAPPRARVVLEATIVRPDGKRMRTRETGEVTLQGASPESLARGMGAALEAAVASLATWLLQAVE